MTPNDLPNILRRELSLKQKRNPRFSLRALANFLQLPSSALSEVMNGKRRVTVALADRIITKLDLPLEEVDQLRAMYSPFELTVLEGKRLAFTPINMDHFRILSEWQHFAILSLTETEDCVGSAEHVARRLGLSLEDAGASLDRLVKLGYLSEGYQKSLPVSYATSDEVMTKSLQKSHKSNLALALKSLEKDPVHLRDFTAITMAIDPAKLGEAKKLIREFRDRLCAFMESDAKQDVYKLCIQLFPLTQPSQGDLS